MAQDSGILITEPGTDAFDAPANKQFMNTTNPFIKIDTENPNGFTTLLLLITTNPTEPVSGYTWTVLTSFAHGYKYVPAVEGLFYTSNPGAGTLAGQTYFQDGGLLSTHSANDYAYLYTVADATNVYIICEKYKIGGGSNNNLTGTNVDITLHVFVEDIGV